RVPGRADPRIPRPVAYAAGGQARCELPRCARRPGIRALLQALGDSALEFAGRLFCRALPQFCCLPWIRFRPVLDLALKCRGLAHEVEDAACAVQSWRRPSHAIGDDVDELGSRELRTGG